VPPTLNPAPGPAGPVPVLEMKCPVTALLIWANQR